MGVETEQLGIKNRYDGKEFRVIEREDGTIAVLAGDTVIVDSGVLPVTATPSGPGPEKLSAGDVVLDQPWWPGRYQLINEYPRPVGIAYNRDGALHTGNANVPAPAVSPSGGGTMAVVS